MTTTRRLLLVFLSCGLAGCAGTAHEPGNLTTAKAKVSAYAGSDYARDVFAVTAKARAWIGKRASQGGKGLAVVFDIDETTLSNLSHMREEDWGYQPKVWNTWVATSQAPAIGPVREVYRTALTDRVAVFFITGRHESDRAATAKNLRAQGMGTYSALIVRPNHGLKRSTAVFKTAQRKHLTEQGYTIIANVGDQASDLEGGYAERTFKLPNPFYLIK